nr:hypothetical protein [Tanacetum cinerariifolium]
MGGKKILITESTMRRDLQLEDAEGVDCLPNVVIIEQLALIGYEKISQKLTFYKAFFSQQCNFLIHTILQCISAKTTAWNELSSTMDSAIIYLATNKKFKFSKYIFERMVKNLDNVNKFLMYPRFVQVFLNHQLEGMSNHNRIYVTPSYIKKMFGNIKRVGKGFSRRDTRLFPTMMVQAQEDIGEGLTNPTDLHHSFNIIQPSTSQPQKTKRHRKPKRKDSELPQTSVPTSDVDEAINKEMDDSLERADTTATRLDAEQDRETTKTTQALEIDSLKRRVKKLEGRKRSRTHGLKRLYKVNLSARVKSSEDEGLDGDEVIVEDVKMLFNVANDLRGKEVFVLQEFPLKEDEDMFSVNDSDGDEVIVEDVKMLFNVANDLRGKEVFVSQEFPLKEIAKPKTTAASTRPKAKWLVIHEQEQALTSTVSSQQPSQVKDKSKGKMVEPEPMKKLSKKDQLMLDEELTFKLQAKEEEEKKACYLKRARDELEQERYKKQKVKDDTESEELKKCLEIIRDDGDDVTIDATPLSYKSPIIIDYKIYQEGKKIYFQIFRADGNSQMYLTFSKMLKNFNREDLEDILYYMLVEKMYPLTNHKLHQMINDVKLYVDYECEMAFELLRLVNKQLKEGHVSQRSVWKHPPGD